MSSIARDIFRGLAGLFYPDICLCCSTGLLQGEKYICGHCFYKLPVTNYHKEQDNPVAQIFWGRVVLEHVTAHYFFKKGNNVQKLIHQMKYQGQKEMGMELGSEMGRKLQTTRFCETNLVVPVPLHPEKIRKRGYNQSEWIARGIAEVMGKPLDVTGLVRHSASASQTRRKRYDRWENISAGFGLAHPDVFSGKHVLLVDDVVTTGATLESCIHAIQQSSSAKISVATLAVASL